MGSQNITEIDKLILSSDLAKKKKVLRYPLVLAELFMSLTIFLYIFGPIKWDTQNSLLLFIYLILYQLSFWMGYKIRASKFIECTDGNDIKRTENKVIVFLKYMIIINLIFTFLNAVLYGMIDNYSLSSLFEKAVYGMFNPGVQYQKKLLYVLEGTSVITWITVAISSALVCTSVLSLVYFKYLKKYQKILVIFTLIVEIMRWLSIGTNKGLFDTVILLYVCIMINNLRSKYYGVYKTRFKPIPKIFIGLLFVVVILFFGYTVGERVDYSYSGTDFNSFPSILCPEVLRSTYVYMTSYLTQGYYGMSLALSLKWIPTLGVGNSPYLMSIIKKILGFDVFPNTYQARLTAFGWDSTSNWHSAYTWFANDIHFFGVIFLMFAVGYFFASIVIESVVKKDPISMAILYLLTIGIIYISANNQVLSISTTFSAFWVLFVIRIVQKITRQKKGSG